MRYSIIGLIILSFILALRASLPSDIYFTKKGMVTFKSDAPLELIEANNENLGLVINRANKSVVAQVPIVNFTGFNSDLQREHFNENYMETGQFAKAIFRGKIIEDVDLMKEGTYKVRVKGMLDIHGVEKERIISGTLVVGDASMKLNSIFEIMLEDHDISIPRIVTQKIAESVEVEMNATLKPK